MAEFISNEVEINRSGVSFERLDGEVVIISFETGKYLNSNGSGADLLYMIEQGVPQSKWDEILSLYFNNFSSKPEEVINFLSLAIDERIIIAGTAKNNTKIDLPLDYQRGEWTPPNLTVFDDLADLLLVDPIHDTSTEGWPKTRDA